MGGGVIAKDTILVVQAKQGTFKAYPQLPASGCLVDPPSAGETTIMCPGHNSQFKIADGSLARGPATRGLSGVPREGAVRLRRAGLILHRSVSRAGNRLPDFVEH